MDILIENYREFKIFFNNNNEKFYFETESYSDGSKSLSVVKKKIDEYIKSNMEFIPFKIINKFKFEIKDVIGIRSDGRFIVNENGRKEQISTYDENDYIIYDEKFDNQLRARIAILEADLVKINNEIKKEKEKITGKNLSQIKENYKKFLK